MTPLLLIALFGGLLLASRKKPQTAATVSDLNVKHPHLFAGYMGCMTFPEMCPVTSAITFEKRLRELGYPAEADDLAEFMAQGRFPPAPGADLGVEAFQPAPDVQTPPFVPQDFFKGGG